MHTPIPKIIVSRTDSHYFVTTTGNGRNFGVHSKESAIINLASLEN
ncbi:MAG: hypothetical protein LBK47_08410 [Prevotellaceae bacterium]|nr:hypothetical protein [Prevotellaceae bacterium]